VQLIDLIKVLWHVSSNLCGTAPSNWALEWEGVTVVVQLLAISLSEGKEQYIIKDPLSLTVMHRALFIMKCEH